MAKESCIIVMEIYVKVIEKTAYYMVKQEKLVQELMYMLAHGLMEK